LERYLIDRVGIAPERVVQIYNGVDVSRFAPTNGRAPVTDSPFNDPRLLVFGTVGRMAPVKNPLLLAQAFVRLRTLHRSTAHVRLVIVGDGPLRQAAADVLNRAGLAGDIWLPGSRDDIPSLLRGMDCFVLPSLAEGISNTNLEAMATGLPVIATNVGGNPELVTESVTGRLVAATDPSAMTEAMLAIVQNPTIARAAGAAGRRRALSAFSLEAMVQRYRAIYDGSMRTIPRRTHRSSLPMRREY
jgi:sugar transferase (PEP-CTERM/EpsH1 system associated)